MLRYMLAERWMHNNVISTLKRRDLDLFKPHLREIELEKDLVIAEPGDDIETVYFPISGIVSFLVSLNDGSFVQTLMVGCDGVVGASQAFDDGQSINKIVVLMAGSALALHRDHLRRIVNDRSEVRHTFAALEQFMLTDIQQTAACNARHSVEQRCARWLMRTRDLVGDQLLITQADLADLIGVRRTSVTEVSTKLQDVGAIGWRRGKLVIVDADRLSAYSCECHQSVRNNYESLFGQPWRRVRTNGSKCGPEPSP